jgi:hypothetical protein
MSDDVKQRRTNDSLQGGEDNPAYGEDERDFGAGRQRNTRALDPGHKDAKDRDPDRDPTPAPGEQAGSGDR